MVYVRHHATLTVGRGTVIGTVFVFVCPLAPVAVFFCPSRLFAILSLNTVCTRTLYAASQTIHIVNRQRALGL